MLSNANMEGTVKTPATEGLFEMRQGSALVPEEKRAKFHRLVAMISYLAKRRMQECMPTTGTLAGQVTKCTEDDWNKLTRLVKYIRYTCDKGVVHPTKGERHICECVCGRSIRGALRQKITNGIICSDRRHRDCTL